VRINPTELHISDHSFYNEIYAGNPKKVDGHLPFTRSTGVSKSMFAAVGHDLHQFRRNILANFFSKRSITNIQPLIQDKIERLIFKLQDASSNGEVVNLTTLSAAFTADVISQYSYGVSLGCLDGKSENILTEATQAVLSFGHWLRFIPIRFSNMKKLHPSLVQNVFPKAATVLRTHRKISSLALEVLNSEEPNSSKETMFTSLADPTLPPEERTLARLEDEGFVVLAAGTETTAYSLSVTLFHLLDNPAIFSKLYNEVMTVMPEPSSLPPLSALENLPLLVSFTL
jgi:cytochrome P450